MVHPLRRERRGRGCVVLSCVGRVFEYLSNKLAARIMTATLVVLVPFAIGSGALAYYINNGLGIVFGILCGIFSVASLIITPLNIVYWHDVWLYELMNAEEKPAAQPVPPPRGQW